MHLEPSYEKPITIILEGFMWMNKNVVGKIQPWRVMGELTAEQLDNIFKVDACVYPDWHENVWNSLKPRFCFILS